MAAYVDRRGRMKRIVDKGLLLAGGLFMADREGLQRRS